MEEEEELMVAARKQCKCGVGIRRCVKPSLCVVHKLFLTKDPHTIRWAISPHREQAKYSTGKGKPKKSTPL
jgi:hypothetical protein